jgi:hypothetical protein
LSEKEKKKIANFSYGCLPETRHSEKRIPFIKRLKQLLMGDKT